MSASQLSRAQRSKWLYVTIGLTLIAFSVALTVGWQFLGAPAIGSSVRLFVHVIGSLMLLLLTGGLVLIFILLLREVRLNERQSNFVSAVTHELKTPVASLRLYLDTLELRPLPEAQRAEFYDTMRQDLDRLNATINNVLQAAMYTDRAVMDPQPIDLARLARHSIELTARRHQLANGSIRYDGPEMLLLRGDATGLETAVLNLLDNAVKYSKDLVDVRVRLDVLDDGSAQLQVQDQGIGMSRAHMAFVFNRFYRIGAEVRRSRPGTGLGLFIVRSVVQGHRGTVTADSPGPERGSTFTLKLPGVLPGSATVQHV